MFYHPDTAVWTLLGTRTKKNSQMAGGPARYMLCSSWKLRHSYSRERMSLSAFQKREFFLLALKGRVLCTAVIQICSVKLCVKEWPAMTVQHLINARSGERRIQLLNAPFWTTLCIIENTHLLSEFGEFRLYQYLLSVSNLLWWVQAHI